MDLPGSRRMHLDHTETRRHSHSRGKGRYQRLDLKVEETWSAEERTLGRPWEIVQILISWQGALACPIQSIIRIQGRCSSTSEPILWYAQSPVLKPPTRHRGQCTILLLMHCRQITSYLLAVYLLSVPESTVNWTSRLGQTQQQEKAHLNNLRLCQSLVRSHLLRRVGHYYRPRK